MAENKENFSTEEAVEEAIKKAAKEAEEAKANETKEEVDKAAADENVADENTEDQATSDTEAGNEEQTEDAADDEQAGGSADKASDKSDKKKSPFKKKDKKDEEIEALTDRVKRQMAEFENFRNRTEKEKSQMYDMGAKSIIEKILPVIDNFERGLANVNEGDDSFSDGILMIYRQLNSTLAEAGVTPIEAVGQEFNPDYHNAVMHVDDEAYGENEVVEELQKGYMYRDTVVRHSMVKVAN